MWKNTTKTNGERFCITLMLYKDDSKRIFFSCKKKKTNWSKYLVEKDNPKAFSEGHLCVGANLLKEELKFWSSSMWFQNTQINI